MNAGTRTRTVLDLDTISTRLDMVEAGIRRARYFDAKDEAKIAAFRASFNALKDEAARRIPVMDPKVRRTHEVVVLKYAG